LSYVSDEIEDLIRAGFDAWTRQDLDGWLELVHPEIEFQTAGVFPGLRPVYRGHAQLRKFWDALHEPWETLRTDVLRIVREGDWAIVEFRFRAKGAESGAEVDMTFAQAMRIEGGLAIEMRGARSFDEAVESLRQERPARPPVSPSRSR
jgi:ketosteroid isomerase-like protein